jgi:hypothetical protein
LAPLNQLQQLIIIDIALTMGDLLETGNFESLSIFDCIVEMRQAKSEWDAPKRGGEVSAWAGAWRT